MSASTILLHQILKRGDSVSIVGGRLCVEPASGAPVPPDWLKAHSREILTEILQRTGQDGFFYENFSTGCYGKCSAPGVTLQFSTIYQSDAYAVFNASLKYDRGSKKGKRYPGKQFRVGQRSAFLKFWKRCGLPLRYRSDLHEQMNQLQGLAFQGSRSNERIAKDTLQPVTMTADTIRRAFVSGESPGRFREDSGKVPGSGSGKESAETLAPADLQPNPTTGTANYGNTVIRECGTRGPSPYPSIPPEDQTHEEWLADYDLREYITMKHQTSNPACD
ncbi:hypothetical protein Q6D67_18610 [Haliea sp. E1-2-M8]|uniref:hypothetical protein n=1 Tax=Haliea sp. E1-2-M8 TaxID=3064706 RepID=UPI0027202A2C|nr:hypothetical protein [Haliea sp. E1-2-M8]MDO8863708.1 hypothetical protein [Haliea sp. E1-2-M8]